MTTPAVPLDPEELLADSTWLRALARGLVRDRFAADDLAQEAWLAALRAREHSAEVPRRTWLSGVLRNVAWKSQRAESRRRTREERGARGEELPSTGALVARAEMQRVLSDAVVALDEPYRTTILLRYLEDLSSAEIARRLDVPEGTVRWRVQRGLELLRARLEAKRGDEWLHSCALLGGLLRAPEATAIATATTAAGSAVALEVAAVVASGAVLAGGGLLGGEWITNAHGTAGGSAAPVVASNASSTPPVEDNTASKVEGDGAGARAGRVPLAVRSTRAASGVEGPGATPAFERRLVGTNRELRVQAFVDGELPEGADARVIALVRGSQGPLDADALQSCLDGIDSEGELDDEQRERLERALRESGVLPAHVAIGAAAKELDLQRTLVVTGDAASGPLPPLDDALFFLRPFTAACRATGSVQTKTIVLQVAEPAAPSPR